MYPLLIQLSLAAGLACVLAAVHLWPAPRPEPPRTVVDRAGSEIIAVDEILPTRQAATRPRPPAPLPPVAVEDDVVLEEPELSFDDGPIALDAPALEAPAAAVEGTAPRAGGSSSARVVRFQQPEYPREARRKGIRAEIVVEVAVEASGRVGDIRIVERYLLSKDAAERTPVEAIGYGIEEAALAVARQWLFRPAREGGRAVRSTTRIPVSFGV